MSLPTIEQALAKFQANPTAAKEFDSCNPQLSRRQHIQMCLAQAATASANVDRSKQLAETRIAQAKLKADLANARARLASLKAQASKVPSGNITAAQFEPQPVTMTLPQFALLSPKAKSDFCLKTKGKLIS